MYVLDTNICIELMAGDRRVIEHMAALERVRVSVSAVTIAELAYGAPAVRNRITSRPRSIDSCATS